MNERLFINLENIIKLSNDTFSIDYNGESLYLKLSCQSDTLNLRLYKEIQTRNIKLADAKKHIIFKDCTTVEDLAQTFEAFLLNGLAKIVEDKNKFHIILSDEHTTPNKVFTRVNNELIIINHLMGKYFGINDKLLNLNRLLEGEFKKFNNQFVDLNKLKDSILVIKDNLSINYNEEFTSYNKKLTEELSRFKSNMSQFLDMVDINNINEQYDSKIIIDTEVYSKGSLKSLKGSKIIGKHKDAINSMILLPNGMIASASNDKTIKIWDINNSICIKSLEGHTDNINILVLLSNGMIASGSSDNTIKIWDYVNENICILSITNICPYSSLLVLNDVHFVSADLNGKIKMFDNQRNYKFINFTQAHSSNITSLIKLKNNHFASGSTDYKIKIWNRNLTLINTLRNYSTINALMLLPNGSLLAGLNNKTYKVWNCENVYKEMKLLTTVKCESYIYTLSSFNNEFSLMGTNDILLIQDNKSFNNIGPYSEFHRLEGHNGNITSTIVLEDKRIVTCSKDSTIRLWA
jgi:WD40 repeat protein